VLMCADCQAARGRGSGPYPVMTQAEMRAGLDLLPSWALEQKAAANRQLIAAMRLRLAAGEQVARMHQEPGPAGHGKADAGVEENSRLLGCDLWFPMPCGPSTGQATSCLACVASSDRPFGGTTGEHYLAEALSAPTVTAGLGRSSQHTISQAVDAAQQLTPVPYSAEPAFGAQSNSARIARSRFHAPASSGYCSPRQEARSLVHVGPHAITHAQHQQGSVEARAVTKLLGPIVHSSVHEAHRSTHR
jgi:hypothetical protein